MKIAILFGNSKLKGQIKILNGELEKIIAEKPGTANKNNFLLPIGGRLITSIGKAKTTQGAFATVVHVATEKNPFSFFLRDVHSETPIYIPEFKVAVVPFDDKRNFEQIVDDISSKKLLSEFGRYANEPEESYENACQYNQNLYCPTWLGISRDMRIFRFGYQPNFKYWGQIQPCYHTKRNTIKTHDKEYAYQINFTIGQGSNCRPKITRRLEDGVLPILNGMQDEGVIKYHVKAFASLEKDYLSQKKIRGSQWEACYANVGGNLTKPEDLNKLKNVLSYEMHGCEQETICAIQVKAVNTSNTPQYAFFKAPHSQNPIPGTCFKKGLTIIASENGSNTKIGGVSKIDGKPMTEEEMSILIQPGKTVILEMLVPHSPVDQKRAEKLLNNWDFEKHFKACREFWLQKLDGAAKINVPELAIDERIKAGLLHCDIATLGQEPNGPALATIGMYGPIGTESAPIIQFYDSMGWHKLAERSIQFFLDRQQENGFMQNYYNYQSETGPVLWSAGEHFRYTKDEKWLKQVMPKLIKSADFLLNWREKNKKHELKEIGCYGLIDGKIADPEDFYHSFFLNAGTYIGLLRMVEMTAKLEPSYSQKLKKELKQYKQDICNAVYFSQANAPVVPLGDGSWAPVLPSWAEYTGAHHLYADGGSSFTHGAFTLKTSILGANWLIFQEVLDPMEEASSFIQKTNQYPLTRENAALSQPYYSRHDFAHIKRGETKEFLKLYYNQFSALQDRETYSFWEHYFGVSEHKTHEEGWFLMQTRWMLYLEEGDTLSLLKVIPRNWLKDGQKINLNGVKSHFGPIELKVNSDIKNNQIHAHIKIKSNHLPKSVAIRLPHPNNLKAINCKGGAYNSSNETIIISSFKGEASVTLTY